MHKVIIKTKTWQDDQNGRIVDDQDLISILENARNGRFGKDQHWALETDGTHIDTREVIVEEERTVMMHAVKGDNELVSIETKIPKKSHIEYLMPCQYSIEVFDVTAQHLVDKFSQESFRERQNILPDYKLLNAALGIYDSEETSKIKKLVKDFRDEYYRCKTEIEKGNLNIIPIWPKISK